MQGADVDILITGGTLLTMSTKMEIIEDSVVGIKDGIIVAVGKKSEKTISNREAEEVIDASGCVILPGLVNTHTHLPRAKYH